MSVAVRMPPRKRSERGLPAELNRRFDAVVFDWDGTAVPDRAAPTGELRKLVKELCAHGMHLIVITGTHVGNVDGQLQARPSGPGRLYFCVNRGSEVFQADENGLRLIERREATSAEDAALNAAAAATVEELARRGITAAIVSGRLNRRKIDVIPEPEWADPPKARITELLEAVESRLRAAGLSGLHDAVEVAIDAARKAGLEDPRVTSDAKHIEIGLTDKSHSAAWAFTELARLGIGASLGLVAGDEFGPLGGMIGSDSYLLIPQAKGATAVSVGNEPTGTPSDVLHLPGGPRMFLRVLRDQLDRRRRGDVPEVDCNPAWTLKIDGLDPKLERVHESLLTIADGRVGTRGAPVFVNGTKTPGVLYAGVYTGSGSTTELAPCLDWIRVGRPLRLRQKLQRTLDLRTGVMREEGPLTVLRFSSLARPGTVALRATAAAERLPRGARRQQGGPVVAALRDRRRGSSFERLGVFDPEESVAQLGLAEAEEAGFERLLSEHREAWGRRWAESDIVLEGDPELQRAIRFTLFHLIGSAGDRGEAAVGARGLSGPAYRGHVFWDSDVFVLPFLAATHPAAARAMLEYRLRRIPAALEAARKLGRGGARFAWESAADGGDVTPRAARLPTGKLARIRTGELEEHIVADVTWAASCYVDWTGDEAFAEGPGRPLFVETARYWVSRARYDGESRAHIYGVIGPDEYHEPVDDNAFTNVMARWNLKRAAALTGVDRRERAEWLRLADALVDGYDAASGIYEQFAGFFELEPLVIAEIAPHRPIAADLLLGAERTARAQVLKQGDVLMLHHLVPDEIAPGSMLPNLDFYEPRTAHGSSLSPAIHAGLLARAGRYRAALESLRLAARLDLDDLTGSTAGGLHVATMGGLWQALVFGFAGIRPLGHQLIVDPRLPPEWHALEICLRFRDEPLRIRIDRGLVSVESDRYAVAPTNDHWEVQAR
jgi:trehalose/maltose hydrolase-like predicted phosphorylase/beta-phosphoglucomutase-like phosphatase (HAD superfamily)